MIATTDLVSLRGRRALITGAASGIGRAIAGRFAEAGASLILLDIDAGGLKRTAAEVKEFGSDVSTETLDLTRHDQIDDLWHRLALDAPDILVNNAGLYPLKDFLEVNEAFLDGVVKVNLEAAFWMSQRFIASRKRDGGIIVNVASIEAILPFKDDLVPYSVSKAGIIALTRSLARDYGRKGFRVNVILPGAIRTPGTDTLVRYAARHLRLDLLKTGYTFQARLALGRWGKPDEVARVALFLASDLASYVQGAMVPVDGGFLSS